MGFPQLRLDAIGTGKIYCGSGPSRFCPEGMDPGETIWGSVPTAFSPSVPRDADSRERFQFAAKSRGGETEFVNFPLLEEGTLF
jgi:hypothetical protein